MPRWHERLPHGDELAYPLCAPEICHTLHLDLTHFDSTDPQTPFALLAFRPDQAAMIDTHSFLALTKTLEVGKWTQIEVDWAIAVPVSITIKFDGEIVLASTPLDPSEQFNSPLVFAGIQDAAGTTPTKVLVDNVLFDFK